jgi:hypothetical protein
MRQLFQNILASFPYYEKIKVGLQNQQAVCVCESPILTYESLNHLYETWYVYNGT